MGIVRKILRNKAAVFCCLVLLVIIILGIFAPVFAPRDPAEMDVASRFLAPSWEYPLGTDHLGRCVLSRLIFGIRTSVLMVMAALIITVVIGTILGFITGFFGGLADQIIMRLCDVILSFPGEVMTLAIIGLLGTGMFNILLASVMLKWAWYARVIRTVVMKYTTMNYIYFSKAIGNKSIAIFLRHIVPVAFPEIMIISSSSLCSMILTVTGLSFLGLGIQPPAPEWGMMLNEAKDVMLSRPSLMLPPGLAVMIVSAASGFFSDALRDALDTKHENRREKKLFLTQRRKQNELIGS
ncbi:MAG: ABC transporter permease subunit [Spirochaetaceae bacterium]|jgi:nickel transport system permease protein|nr:ABC transporter permease subunit [Spirochaetaceae bacterium]